MCLMPSPWPSRSTWAMERAGQWPQPGASVRTESQCINEAANPGPANVPRSTDQSVKRQSSTSTLVMSNPLWAPFPLDPTLHRIGQSWSRPFSSCPSSLWVAPHFVWVAHLVCWLHPWFASCTVRGLQLASPWFAASTLPGLWVAPHSLFVGCTTLPVCWLHHPPVCWLHHPPSLLVAPPSQFVGCTTLPVCWLHHPPSLLVPPSLFVGRTCLCLWAAPHVCGLHPLCVGCTPSVWVAPHFVCGLHPIVCVWCTPLCRTPQFHPLKKYGTCIEVGIANTIRACPR